jgi:molybdenum-dependent DNA-binding transcriptional regulator ModE
MAALSRVRTMPWLMVLQLAMTLRKHWKYLEPTERARLGELVKRSQGRPNRLDAAERREVRRLVAKLEPMQIARSVVPIGRRATKLRRGR